MTTDEQKRFYTYIILCEDGSYYTGYSDNPHERFKVHQSGKGAKYTRSHKPVKLVLVSPAMTKSAAMKAEYKIKQLSHSQKVVLIQRYNDLKTIAKVDEEDMQDIFYPLIEDTKENH